MDIEEALDGVVLWTIDAPMFTSVVELDWTSIDIERLEGPDMLA